MAEFDPVEAVRRYHQAIGDLDFEAIGAAFAEDAVYLSGGTGDVAGRAAILDAFRAYFTRWRDQVAEDDLIEAIAPNAARSVWRLRAVEAATGVQHERRGVEIVRFDAQGLIRTVEVSDEI